MYVFGGLSQCGLFSQIYFTVEPHDQNFMWEKKINELNNVINNCVAAVAVSFSQKVAPQMKPRGARRRMPICGHRFGQGGDTGRTKINTRVNY